MQKKVRMNAVEVIINGDLTVSYRLTLQIKTDYARAMDQKFIRYRTKGNNILSMFEYKSRDRLDVMHVQTAAQIAINEMKMKDLKDRSDMLMDRMEEIAGQITETMINQP